MFARRGTKARRTAHRTQPTVLLVDDDASAGDVFSFALRRAGFNAIVASDGAQAMTASDNARVDLAVIDLRLPDMSGLAVAEALRDRQSHIAFVLMSAFLETTITVTAMKMGAVGVLDKPLDVEALCALAVRTLPTCAPLGNALADFGGADFSTASAAQRWSRFVLRGTQAKSDLPSLHHWGREAAVGVTGLRESCRMLGMKARDARDFTRVLRAMLLAHAHRCDPQVFLDVHDERTLQHLLERGGFDPSIDPAAWTLDGFLASQQFVHPPAPVLDVLRQAIRR